MKKILVYLLYTFPQLLLAQADGAGTEHGLDGAVPRRSEMLRGGLPRQRDTYLQ